MTQHETAKKKAATQPLKSERVDELVAELVAGADLGRIAEQEGLTFAQANHLKRKAGLAKKMPRWTDAERVRAAALHDRGEAVEAIARVMGRAKSAVKRELVRQGKLAGSKRARSEEAPQVVEAVEALTRAMGWSSRKIPRYEALLGRCQAQGKQLVAYELGGSGCVGRLPATSKELAGVLLARREALGKQLKACAQAEGVYASVWSHRERGRVGEAGFTLAVVVRWCTLLDLELRLEGAEEAVESAPGKAPTRYKKEEVVSEEGALEEATRAALEALYAALTARLGADELGPLEKWSQREVSELVGWCAQVGLVPRLVDDAGTLIELAGAPGEVEQRLRAYRLAHQRTARELSLKEGGNRSRYVRRELRARRQTVRLGLLLRWGLALGLACVLDEVD